MERTKEDFRKFYEEKIKGKSKEEAIEYLEEMKFGINMIDRWSREDENAWSVLTDMIKEIKGEL